MFETNHRCNFLEGIVKNMLGYQILPETYLHMVVYNLFHWKYRVEEADPQKRRFLDFHFGKDVRIDRELLVRYDTFPGRTKL